MRRRSPRGEASSSVLNSYLQNLEFDGLGGRTKIEPEDAGTQTAPRSPAIEAEVHTIEDLASRRASHCKMRKLFKPVVLAPRAAVA